MRMHSFRIQPNNRYSNRSPARRILRISFLLPEYLPAEFPFSSQEFIGYGNRTFEAPIDVAYWTDVLIDYTVRITAIDAASNEIQMDKTIEGFFGGVLDFLEDIWNAIVGTITAAWNAVVEAVNWIVDLVIHMIKEMIDAVITPIRTAIESWVEGFVDLIASNFEANSPIRVIGDFLDVVERVWSYMLIPFLIVGTLIAVAEAIEVILAALSMGSSNILARVVQAVGHLFLFGAIGAAIGAVCLAFENGINWIFLDELVGTASYITGHLGTQQACFEFLKILVIKSLFTSAAAPAVLSIFPSLAPKTQVWWWNLLLDAFALMLAIAAVRDYRVGPDEILAKVITPFVATIVGILAYSSLLTIMLTITSDTLSGAILP